MRILSMATGRLCLSLALAVFSLLAVLPAAATTIDPTNGGLDQASGCTDSACFGKVYDVVTDPGAVSGTLDISGGLLDFTINLTGATLSSTAGDGGVKAIVFDLVYTGQVSVSLDASDNYVIDFGQTGEVNGSATPIGAGSPAPVAAAASLLTGACSGTPGGAMQCGLTFSPTTDLQAEINGNTRYFEHKIDVFTVVPEPGTAMLLGLGLAGLAGARRSERVAA